MLVALLSLLAIPAAAEQDLAAELMRLTNELRQRYSLPLLKPHRSLTQAAVSHSLEMLEMGYFSHRSPVVGTPLDRVRLAGGFDLAVAENIYRCQGFPGQQVSRRALESLLRSPNHRRHLLNPRFNRVGVGVVGDGSSYLVTQLFSYQSVDVVNVTSRPEGPGFLVDLTGEVVDGARQGAIFFGQRSVARWKADAEGRFRATFTVPGPGLVGVGQTSSPGNYSIDAEVTVGG